MRTTFWILLGILIPFFGTSLGAGIVFLFPKKEGILIQKILYGFAAGVMIASSIWSLILPALENAKRPIDVALGFLGGILFLILCDRFCEHSWQNSFPNTKQKMILAVTLHNLPEGMAVGVAFAAAQMSASLSLWAAFLISIGIALQNIPEGAILSLPIFAEKNSRAKAFFWGMLSGVVEPIGAAVAFLLTRFVSPLLPFLLSFAAGAMIDVAVEELIPTLHFGERKKVGIFSLGIGFCVMMLMDVILG